MPTISFSKFMTYQTKAMKMSNQSGLEWIDKHAARFRRRVEKHFVVR